MLAFKNLLYNIIGTTWSVGIVENTIESLMQGEKMKFHLVKHDYKDRWFADPFVYDVTDDAITLFVEEYYNPIGRGRISKMVVDKKTYQLLSLKTILELDTHLSFPFIVRENGKIYICPENSEADEWALYEYDDQQEQCTKVSVLANGSYADAVLCKRWGRNMMLATTYPNHNGNQIDIYDFSEEDKEYHQTQSFSFDERIGRNAGDYFEYNKRVYRPAQDCGLCYGHAVSIQEITNNGSELTFKEVRRLYPPNKFLMLGMHTLNSYKGAVVADATVYKYPLFGSILYWLKEHLGQ